MVSGCGSLLGVKFQTEDMNTEKEDGVGVGVGSEWSGLKRVGCCLLECSVAYGNHAMSPAAR